ncbi:MAG TPA: UvrD-helicase domain-containing protein [Syntrophomonadaceae bacterium]|nr:UvrD-helicase domain-containing protein [Syntrophomonadaceae bacterium]
MKLTDEQRLAVEKTDISICISAGAGTGKTRVLVERYWQLIELGYEIDEILAVTFTRKAAREMMERIRKRVDESELSPDRKRMLKDNLSTSWIGTIDSICSRIIRDYPIEADIDPYFNIADEMTIKELKDEIVRGIVLREIEAQEAPVLEYIELFGYTRLNDDIQELFNLIAQKGLDLKKIQDMTMESIEEVEANLSVLISEIEKTYALILACQSEIGEKTATYSKVSQMVERRDIFMEALLNISNLKNSDEDKAAFDDLQALCKGNHAKVAKEHFNNLRNLLDQLEGSLQDIYNKRYITILFSLTKEMRDKFLEVKGSNNLLEYTDLVDKTIKVLKEYPEVLAHFQNQFKHIMVDEFQDTNYRQVELVETISNNYINHVFAIGDPKQSIYRFRGAQVNLFEEVNNKIGEQGGLSHKLGINFRTRENLINLINGTFAHLMQDDQGMRFEPLVAARPSPKNEHAEIHLIKEDGESELGADEAEAYCIVRRIVEMVDNEEKLVYEKDGLNDVARAVKYADIALLFQKSKSMDICTAVLRDYNIPYYVVGGHGFFDTEEVNTIILFLKVINDNYDELSLVGLLRSPIFGVSDEALWYMKQQDQSIHQGLLNLDNYATSLKPADYNTLQFAQHLIRYCSENKSRFSVEEIIAQVILHTSYDAFLVAQSNGEQKLANVKKLLELVKNQTRETYDELGEFLKYVANAKAESSMDEQQAVLDSEADNAVKLMTIHQSKGLEFPIVILPYIHQRFNLTDATDKVVFSDNMGIFLRTDPKSYLRIQAEEEEKNLVLQEYKRLFYVAQTRACDYLIFSGSYQEKKQKDTYIVEPYKHSWLRWIFDYYQVKDQPINEKFVENGIKTYLYEQGQIETIKADELSTEFDAEKKHNLSRYEFQLNSDYPHRQNISATRLMDYQYCPFYAYLKHSQGLSPRLVYENEIDIKVLDPVNIGNIIHNIIEEASTLADAKSKLKERLKGIDQPVSDELKLEMNSMLENYYENEIIKKIEAESELLKEVPFLARINKEVFVNGFIDQLWLGEKTYGVLDLKTGKMNPNQEDYDIQLNLYRLALDKILDRQIEHKGIFYLRDGLIKDVDEQLIDFTIDPTPSPKEGKKCNTCINEHICFP